MDNRAHPRFEAGVEALVEHRRLGTLTAKIRDVSANGIFLELPQRFASSAAKPGVHLTPVTVKYRLPKGPAGRPRIWRGYVARSDQSGVGVSISKINPSGDPNLAMLVDYARRGDARRGATAVTS